MANAETTQKAKYPPKEVHQRTNQNFSDFEIKINSLHIADYIPQELERWRW